MHAVPCVGDADYLLAQMQRLDAASGGVGRLPCVLPPPSPVPCGSPNIELLEHWRESARGGCLLDLLYGPVAWSAMAARRWERGSELLYVNTGVHEGLASQLRRYARAGLLQSGEDVQLTLRAAMRESMAAAERLQ